MLLKDLSAQGLARGEKQISDNLQQRVKRKALSQVCTAVSLHHLLTAIAALEASHPPLHVLVC